MRMAGSRGFNNYSSDSSEKCIKIGDTTKKLRKDISVCKLQVEKPILKKCFFRVFSDCNNLRQQKKCRKQNIGSTSES